VYDARFKSRLRGQASTPPNGVKGPGHAGRQVQMTLPDSFGHDAAVQANRIGMAMRRLRVSSAATRSLGVLAVALFIAIIDAPDRAAGAGQASAVPREVARVTFAVAGDVIPHQAVAQAAAAQAKTVTGETHGGWDVLFADVADIFRQADFGFVNLETPVAPMNSRGSKPFQFDAPINLLRALTASGVRIVSFANNHVFDQGQAGFKETLLHLRDEKLLVTGAADTVADLLKPTVTEKNGITVGWIGATRWLNGNRNPVRDTEPHVAFVPYANDSSGAPGLSEAALVAAVSEASMHYDLVVVSIHWGIEYATTPLDADVALAHKLLDAGASAVIGHHPHVLQTIETYVTPDGRSTVILYSLGNFLSNQSRNFVQGLTPDKTGEPRDSMMVTFAAVRKDYGPAGMRVELGHVGMLPAWSENNGLQLRSGAAKVAMIKPVLIDREIPRLQRIVDTLQASPLTASQKQEFMRTSNQLDTLKKRRELLLGRTGDDYVIAAPPTPAPVQ
jgi:poly-gamma-glutamate synthesis protein (capsule biosynthesis protein)